MAAHVGTEKLYSDNGRMQFPRLCMCGNIYIYIYIVNGTFRTIKKNEEEKKTKKNE